MDEQLDPNISYIPLSQGQVAIVDAADYEWLMQWNWFARLDGKTYYAVRHERGNHRKMIKMHSQILPADGGRSPDHKNRNGLDNRRDNLRPATLSQQGANRTSKNRLKGVRQVGDNLYQARIGVNKKQISLGTAHSKVGAALIYDEAAKLYYGEFANLNFPPEHQLPIQ